MDLGETFLLKTPPKGMLSTRVHMNILNGALASKRITKQNKRLIREFLYTQ